MSRRSLTILNMYLISIHPYQCAHLFDIHYLRDTEI